MELNHDFRVPVPVERAWDVLTDVELIAPCLPGAQLQEIEGDEYRGIVKVKVGPITAQYKGAATFKEKDESARRIVLDASGRDTKGQGSAAAVITATLADEGDATAVSVVTDLTIKGKVAQFGRGMLAEVSGKLLDQFVECLEGLLVEQPGGAEEEAAAATPSDNGAAAASEPGAEAASEPAAEAAAPPAPEAASAPAAGAAAAGSSGPRRIDSPEAEPVDLLEAAGSPVLKRAVPVVAVILLLYLLGRRRARG